MENKFCVICQECITDENIKKTECNHEFHLSCYDEYLKRSKKNECPICRNHLNEKIYANENIHEEPPNVIIHETIQSTFSNGILTIHLPTNGLISPNAQVEIPTEFFLYNHSSRNPILDLTEINEIEGELEDLESRRELEREFERASKQMVKHELKKQKRKERKEKKKNYQKNNSSIGYQF